MELEAEPAALSINPAATGLSFDCTRTHLAPGSNTGRRSAARILRCRAEALGQAPSTGGCRPWASWSASGTPVISPSPQCAVALSLVVWQLQANGERRVMIRCFSFSPVDKFRNPNRNTHESLASLAPLSSSFLLVSFSRPLVCLGCSLLFPRVLLVLLRRLRAAISSVSSLCRTALRPCPSP